MLGDIKPISKTPDSVNNSKWSDILLTILAAGELSSRDIIAVV